MSVRAAATAILTSCLIAAAVSGTLAVSGLAEDSEPQDVVIESDWAYEPKDLEDLADKAQVVIVAEVADVRQGPTIASSSGGLEFETQLIDFAALAAVAGKIDETFTLYRLGGENTTVTEDSEYSVGEKHLLFLQPEPPDPEQPELDGTWVTVAPEGRYEQDDDGKLVAEVDGPVAEKLDGLDVDAAVNEVKKTGEGVGSIAETPAD